MVGTVVAPIDAGKERSVGLVYVSKRVCGKIMVLLGAVSPFGDRRIDLGRWISEP